MCKIPGGYILLSRKLLESEIMRKPPLYLKVFTWLLLKAQHKPYDGIERGELVTSIPEIQDAMEYKIGFRKVRPSKKQIWDILEWMRRPNADSDRLSTKVTMKVTMKETMIETTKVTKKIRIKLVNYDVYQNPDNYEGNDKNSTKVTMKVTTTGTPNNKQECYKNDNYKYSRQKTADESSEQSMKVPVKKIVDAWNEVFAGTLVPKVREVNASRAKWIKREYLKQRDDLKTVEDFKALFEYIRDDCPFIMQSLADGRSWFSFNWLFKYENNFTKVIEGTYEARNKTPDKGKRPI